jgi:telomerase reverse transcriptase
MTFVNMGKLRKEFRRTAKLPDDLGDFFDFANEITKQLENAIVVDYIVHVFEDRDDMLEILRQHIVNHIVKVGKNYYKQIIGIPQGSIVSTLLCR